MPLTINAPDVEHRLQQEATRQGLSADALLLQLLHTYLAVPQQAPREQASPDANARQPQQATEELPFYATATPEEWEREFLRWVDSHKDMNLPQLPPEAYERASFYEDERHLRVESVAQPAGGIA